MRTRWAGFCLCAPLLLHVTPATAEGPAQPPSTKSNVADQAADQLFREGQELMQAGKFGEACDRLERSLKIEVALGTLLNLGFCHEHDGRYVAAWDEYRQAADLAEQRNDAQRHDFAVGRMRDLEKRLARVQLIAPPGQSVSEVKVDGQIVALDANKSFVAEPGPHLISATLKGRKRFERNVTLSTQPEQIGVPPAPPDAAPPTTAPLPPAAHPSAPPAGETNPPPTAGDGTRRTLGWIAGGVGLVGLGLGTYFGIETFAIRNNAADHGGCVGSQCNIDALARIQGPATTTALLSTVSFGVGIVGVGLGTWLLLSSQGGTASAVARPGTHIVPLVGANGGGLRVEGPW